jgi:hypothetical protein
MWKSEKPGNIHEIQYHLHLQFTPKFTKKAMNIIEKNIQTIQTRSNKKWKHHIIIISQVQH